MNWDKFLKEGDGLFVWMTQNYETMIDGDKIKHFDIRYGTYLVMDEEEEIKVKLLYGDEIQKEIIPWIKNEYESGRLFEKTNWKPFRDQYLLTHMYFGYKYTFKFKNYYLQIALDSACGICEYCKKSMSRIHFELALYGWKEDNKEKIQPDNEVILPTDNIMPEWYWNTN